MRDALIQQQENELTNREMLSRKNEDVLSGRVQACVKQEGEIEDQVEKLKMRDVRIQQQENACAQREKCVGEEEVRLM